MFISKLLISMSAAMALLSCNVQPQSEMANISNEVQTLPSRGVDGYIFEQAEYSADQLSIRIIRYNSIHDVSAVWNRNPENVERVPSDRIVVAFTEFSYSRGVATCTLHIVDPRLRYQPEYLGHELVHCMHGSFHPNHWTIQH